MQQHSTSASALTTALNSKHPGSNDSSGAHSDSDSAYGSESDSGSDGEESDSDAEVKAHIQKLHRDFEYYIQDCLELISVVRPAERFILDKTSVTTGYDMIRIANINKIIEPRGSRCAVAVIQGLRVGYYETWQAASKEVRVVGAIYSFHPSYREARICYMQALINGDVCCLLNDRLTKIAITPRCSQDDQNFNDPVPSVKPVL
ncbi:hypothetical protein BT96DRAFT_943952 [Gymnopus androsaceus JB14]|uniref:Uncharacterized protein n=1 Tax=Gymnopus androsaceus JB14 TaxID=1447944 RepID=A0A6A4H5J6_9AGAR|nr:hypothetical protein BT96DRAFT_943952 [Gymnopus androsaceus JB14]